eukprot:386577-Alexandrium_andersonii.AAC.1
MALHVHLGCRKHWSMDWHSLGRLAFKPSLTHSHRLPTLVGAVARCCRQHPSCPRVSRKVRSHTKPPRKARSTREALSSLPGLPATT